MKRMTLLVLVAFACAEKIPDFVIPGKCPEVDRQALYDAQRPNHHKFGGSWHIYAMTENPYDLLEKCSYMEFDFDGNEFGFKATGVAYDGNLLRRNGKVYPSPFGEPYLAIDVEDSWAAPLVVLDTDYTNYACLHSCLDINPGYTTDFNYIYVRSPNPDEKYVKKCTEVFAQIGVEASRFQKVTQGSNCPYHAQKAL